MPAISRKCRIWFYLKTSRSSVLSRTFEFHLGANMIHLVDGTGPSWRSSDSFSEYTQLDLSSADSRRALRRTAVGASPLFTGGVWPTAMGPVCLLRERSQRRLS